MASLCAFTGPSLKARTSEARCLSPAETQSSFRADSENFDEFILAIVSTVNQQTVATQIGFYSTKTSRIAIDQINPSLVKIPLEQIPITNPVYETSDQMTEVNQYLLRVGPRSKFDFNYQPLANMIRARWASIEYPANYYMKGGKIGRAHV